jgi:predicted enzyme related to lactoylglutathione lyase
MLDGLNFIVLHVPDIEEARAFYTEKLGFQIDAQSPKMVRFSRTTTGAIFAIEETKGTLPIKSIDLWWQVSDADALYAQLLEKDVEVISPPDDKPYGRTMIFKDNAGNELRVLQMK